MESLGRGVETSIDDKEEKKPSNEGDEAQSVCCLSISHCDQFVNKNRPAHPAPRAVKQAQRRKSSLSISSLADSPPRWTRRPRSS